VIVDVEDRGLLGVTEELSERVTLKLVEGLLLVD